MAFSFVHPVPNCRKYGNQILVLCRTSSPVRIKMASVLILHQIRQTIGLLIIFIQAMLFSHLVIVLVIGIAGLDFIHKWKLWERCFYTMFGSQFEQIFSSFWFLSNLILISNKQAGHSLQFHSCFIFEFSSMQRAVFPGLGMPTEFKYN